MVSPELLRRYPFFSGLASEQINSLARIADEVRVEPGEYLFHEGVVLANLYLVIEGKVAITLSQPEVISRTIIPPPGARTREVSVSIVCVGDIFGWSSLVPPFKATSNARAATRCRILTINSAELRQLFEIDPRFGYLVMVRVAQVARDRLHDMHYEALTSAVGESTDS